MKLKIIKKGFNYSQDGPGNRLVYHLQGCNMSCRWCANPESISANGVLMTDKEKLLETVCPYHAIQDKVLDRQVCHNCTELPCLYKNRNEGIRFSCFVMGVNEIIDEVKESSPLFFDGGGVTFSGGEPTCQFIALKELLVRLKEERVSTAIETNGTHKQLEELFPYIDVLIMDFKHIDDERHKEYTGISNEEIKVNIGKAMNRHPNVLIRTPLINAFNADEAYIEKFLAFYKQFNSTNTRFEFLKYHEYGREKWEQCGMTYKMHDGHIKEGLAELFEAQYRASGLTVVRT